MHGNSSLHTQPEFCDNKEYVVALRGKKQSGEKKAQKRSSAKKPAASVLKKAKADRRGSELAASEAPLSKEGDKKTGHSAPEGKTRNKHSREIIDNTHMREKLIDEEEGVDNIPPDPEAIERGDTPMTLVEHLSEMRSRLLVVLAALLVIMLIAFGFSDYLLTLISRPFITSGQKLNLFTLFEGFTLRLKSSLFASALICLPLIVYQIWKYIEPAINRHNRTMIRLALFSSIFLFYSGTVFSYFFLPLAIIALMRFAPPDMLITNNATEYFNFFLMTSLILGAVFELPVIILLLTKMGIISPIFLTRKRKYAIVIIWIIAALASPGPDPLSQALLALPLMLLYELSIVISKAIVRRKKKRELELSS